MWAVISTAFIISTLTSTSHADTVDIDLHLGVVRGFSQHVTFIETPTQSSSSRSPRCGRQSVIRVDLTSPYKLSAFVLEYDRPRLWTLDVSDSATADGHGGNAGCEMSVHNRQMRLHSNSLPGYRSATIDGGFLIKVVDNVVRQGSRLNVQIGDSQVSWGIGGRKDAVHSPFLFAFSAPNATRHLYAAFNRIVAGNWRNGTGLCRATIHLLTEEDECVLGTHQCDANAACKSRRKSYRCRCKTGYEGDGKKCHDRDECKVRNGGCVHRCHNAPGNYSCSCYDGFYLDKDGHNCIDVNECAGDKGGCDHHCVNTIGTYECHCNSGYTLAPDGRSCHIGSWCREQGCKHSCELTRSSFVCTCRGGWLLAPDGRSCVQSCAHGNGGCQHRCTHTNDGPVCTCHYKYILGLDKKSCTPSCAINNGGCDRRCSTTPQGLVKCTCPNGFVLHRDGRICLDVDECLVKNGGCSSTCVNSVGSYECVCPRGFKLLPDEKTCSEFDECSVDDTCDHVCINSPGSYHCNCHQGYDQYGFTHCGDRDECAEDNGGCEHLCLNGPGSFRCGCHHGYVLHPNGKDCTEVKPCQHGEGPVRIGCRNDGHRDVCGIRCATDGQFNRNGNKSYSYTCGKRSPPCSDGSTCSDSRRVVRLVASTHQCQLVERRGELGAKPTHTCLPLGVVNWVKVSCVPHNSIVQVDMDITSVGSCDAQCQNRFLWLMKRVLKGNGFFFSDRNSFEHLVIRESQNASETPACPPDQARVNGRCVSPTQCLVFADPSSTSQKVTASTARRALTKTNRVNWTATLVLVEPLTALQEERHSLNAQINVLLDTSRPTGSIRATLVHRGLSNLRLDAPFAILAVREWTRGLQDQFPSSSAKLKSRVEQVPSSTSPSQTVVRVQKVLTNPTLENTSALRVQETLPPIPTEPPTSLNAKVTVAAGKWVNF